MPEDNHPSIHSEFSQYSRSEVNNSAVKDKSYWVLICPICGTNNPILEALMELLQGL